MTSDTRATTRRILAIAGAGLLVLAAAPVSAVDTVDELQALNQRAWNEDSTLLSEVYAPDGVHTATFYDRTNEYAGPDEIDRVAGSGTIEFVGPRIDIPAADGEWRWASFVSLGGGAACLFRAVDGRITRHDCVLPEYSYGSQAPVGLADADASAAIDEISARLSESWGPGTSVERLAEVYAPDAVHTARYLNTTRRYTGPEEILSVARFGGTPQQIGERVGFEAPEGVLAWAQVVDVAGGSVCLFRAVDGLVTHHDCVLPISG